MAINIAMDKLNSKVNEMIDLINIEKNELVGDFENAKEIIMFYEK